MYEGLLLKNFIFVTHIVRQDCMGYFKFITMNFKDYLIVFGTTALVMGLFILAIYLLSLMTFKAFMIIIFILVFYAVFKGLTKLYMDYKKDYNE